MIEVESKKDNYGSHLYQENKLKLRKFEKTGVGNVPTETYFVNIYRYRFPSPGQDQVLDLTQGCAISHTRISLDNKYWKILRNYLLLDKKKDNENKKLYYFLRSNIKHSQDDCITNLINRKLQASKITSTVMFRSAFDISDDRVGLSPNKSSCRSIKCPFRQLSPNKIADLIAIDFPNQAKHISQRVSPDENSSSKEDIVTSYNPKTSSKMHTRKGHQRSRTLSSCGFSSKQSTIQTPISTSWIGSRSSGKPNFNKRSKMCKSSPPKLYEGEQLAVDKLNRKSQLVIESDITKDAVTSCKIIRANCIQSPVCQPEDHELSHCQELDVIPYQNNEKYTGELIGASLVDSCSNYCNSVQFGDSDQKTCIDSEYTLNFKTDERANLMFLNVSLGFICSYKPLEENEPLETQHTESTEIMNYKKSISNFTQLGIVEKVSVSRQMSLKCEGGNRFQSYHNKLNPKKHIFGKLKKFEVIEVDVYILIETAIDTSIQLCTPIKAHLTDYISRMKSFGVRIAITKFHHTSEMISVTPYSKMRNSGMNEISFLQKLSSVDNTILPARDNTYSTGCVEEIFYDSKMIPIKNVEVREWFVQAPLQFEITCKNIEIMNSTQIHDQAFLLSIEEAVNCTWKEVESSRCLQFNSACHTNGYECNENEFVELIDIENDLRANFEIHTEANITTILLTIPHSTSSTNIELKSVNLSYSRQRTLVGPFKTLLRRWGIASTFVLSGLVLAKYCVFSLEIGDWASICGAGFAYFTVFFLLFINFGTNTDSTRMNPSSVKWA